MTGSSSWRAADVAISGTRAPRSAGTSRTVGILGAFGIANFGNDASLTAALAGLRDELPGCRVVCICSDPDLIAAEHGVETLPLHFRDGPSRLLQSESRAVRILARLPREVVRWWDAYRQLRRVDQLVVAGTGILDDQHSRPGGAPYDLFLWCTAARFARCPVFMLSVGAGPIWSRLNRVLILGAARHARYISYRDQSSREFMSSIGRDVIHDVLAPDLVFGPAVPAEQDHRSGCAVAVGVMSDCNWPDRPDEFELYLDRIEEVVRGLLREGADVRLVIGDKADRSARLAVVDRLIADDRAGSTGQVDAPAVDSFDEVLDVLRGCDVVIASRYHNLVAAFLLGRPVISLEYGFKNTALMSELGFPENCHHIDAFQPDKIVAEALELLASPAPPTGPVERYRELLAEQYRHVSGADRRLGSGVDHG